MTTLLPTLLSDDEGPLKDSKDIAEDDSSESSEEGIDGTFEFGGILGEDGGLFSSSSSGGGATGWSYQTALKNLEDHDANRNGALSTAVPRMDVASLIAAKRKTIVKESQKKTKKETTKKDESDNNESDHDGDDDDASTSSSGSSGSSSSSGSSGGSSTSSSSVDAQQDKSHENLEEDVLKTRAGRDGTNESENDNKEKDDEEDDDDEDISNARDDNNETEEAKREALKALAFFDQEAQVNNPDDIQMFSQLTLSRPILRGVASMGYVQPTPIQASVIPLALAGRDVCASAVTGSGKTAAFLLPLLERLLHLSGRHIKALVMVPTRELAAQCLGMVTTLAQYTKLRACLIVGGTKNVQAQASELKSRPDLVVATPGRLLDHIMNTAGVNLDNIDYLVLDEADRLLDLGFEEEVHQIVKACPVNRQTLLFSATMNNTKVDDLVRLSLKRPVRVSIKGSKNTQASGDKSNSGSNVEVAPRLEQEFVRVRSGNEGMNREAMLLALLTRTFTKQVIVFFDTKAAAHRLMILCGLLGLKCSELHGNLTQKQRLQALEDFREGEVDILLATDLAARGLDIDRVSAVINFEMPSQIETYIHRIGRTARAGRGGRSCTLIGEGRRHLMKEIIKDAEAKKQKRNKSGSNGTAGAAGPGNVSFETGIIRSRAIPPAVISHFAEKIKGLEPHVEEVVQAEQVARMDRLAEMEVMKAQNIIEHSNEIQARPKREWFASENEKKLTKQAAIDKQNMIKEKAGTGVHRMTRKKRRAREAMQALNASREGGDDDGDGNVGNPKDKSTKGSLLSVKAAARKKKKADEAKERQVGSKSLAEYEAEKQERAQQNKKRKKVGRDAVGDSTLFDDMDSGDGKRSGKNGKKQAKDGAGDAAIKATRSSYEFRGFDPTKKLGKKRGVKAFKSKAKYRRK